MDVGAPERSQTLLQGTEMGNVEQEYLKQSGGELRRLKNLADQAIDQVSVANLYTSLDENGNCIAVLMKHVAGFLESHWTDFLDSNGGKPDWRREREFFIEEGESSEVILAKWERGWRALFGAIHSLRQDDLLRRVSIGGRSLTVLRAIQLSLSHLAQHVGQIVFLAKHMKGCDWKPLSSPLSEAADSTAVLVEQEC